MRLGNKWLTFRTDVETARKLDELTVKLADTPSLFPGFFKITKSVVLRFLVHQEYDRQEAEQAEIQLKLEEARRRRSRRAKKKVSQPKKEVTP